MIPEENLEDLIEDLSTEDLALLEDLSIDENLLTEGKLEDLNIAIDKHTKKLALAVKNKNAEAADMHREFINKLRKQKFALTEAFNQSVDDLDESVIDSLIHSLIEDIESSETLSEDEKKDAIDDVSHAHSEVQDAQKKYKKKENVKNGQDLHAAKVDRARAVAKAREHQPRKGKGRESQYESVDYTADLAVLVESDANLTEDFKEKAAVIFEVALNQKLRSEKVRLAEESELKVEAAVTKNFNFLVGKIDSYLSEAVDGWIEENKVAIDSGLRTEIAESFIKSLKGVFTEHYIEVPDSKKDLVDQLSNEIDELKESFEAKEAETKFLVESVESLTRSKILSEESGSLVDTQAAKLLDLVEDIEFVSEETFRKKVTTIKESFFAAGNKPAGKSVTPLTQVGKPGVIVEDVAEFTPTPGASANPLMDSVLSVMKQMQKNQ